MANELILGNFFFYSLNSFLQIRSMIDMNMAEHTPGPFMFAYIIFQMFLFMILTVLQRIMPFGQILQYFRIHIPLFIKKIDAFIKVDYDMKQGIQSTVLLTDSR